MTIDYKVYSFPNFPIDKQVFYVPGTSMTGGFTNGGVRISSPSPGGYGVLEIQPALQVNEWDYPISSWLMSKTSGQILRVRMARTPQISMALIMRAAPEVMWDTGDPWSSLDGWDADIIGLFASAALYGSNTVKIDMSSYGQKLQPGHVIGHKFSTYLIDEISYDSGNIATVVVTPPFRATIAAGDAVLFRPYFTGMIANSGDIIESYDSANDGNIQLPKIILNEVVLP